MKMQKNKLRIGDVAKELKVEQFVIRFWEKEFDLNQKRSVGGQRFYKTQDVKKFQVIKELLYEKGLTIAGAKKQLETAKNPTKTTTRSTTKDIIAASMVTSAENAFEEITKQEIHNLEIKNADQSRIAQTPEVLDTNLIGNLIDLQKKLIKIRELL